MGDKNKNRPSSRKQDGNFPSKQVKHDPQAESARAIFGKRDNGEWENQTTGHSPPK